VEAEVAVEGLEGVVVVEVVSAEAAAVDIVDSSLVNILLRECLITLSELKRYPQEKKFIVASSTRESASVTLIVYGCAHVKCVHAIGHSHGSTGIRATLT
jgi:hypothetical protein